MTVDVQHDAHRFGIFGLLLFIVSEQENVFLIFTEDGDVFLHNRLAEQLLEKWSETGQLTGKYVWGS